MFPDDTQIDASSNIESIANNLNEDLHGKRF